MSRRITTTDEKIISDVAIQPRQDDSAARLLEAALEYINHSEARTVNFALKDSKGTALVTISFVEEATRRILKAFEGSTQRKTTQ